MLQGVFWFFFNWTREKAYTDTMWPLVQTLLLCAGVLASYVVAGRLQLFARKPFLRNPLWLDLPVPVVVCTVAFQVVALASYLTWMTWVSFASRSGMPSLYMANALFFVSQAAWPFAVASFARERTARSALLGSIPLWVSALAVLWLLRVSHVSHPVPTVASNIVATLVVVVDGLLWTVRAFALSR